MGFLAWLTVLFVALKLIGVIDWSWWLVVSPMYVWVAFIVLMFAIGVIGGMLGEIERRR